jgi:dienelactone hydrolase
MCLGNLTWIVGLLVALGVCAATEHAVGAGAVPEWIKALQTPRALAKDQKPPVLPDLLVAPDGSRITTADEWEGQRQLILNKWLRFLGQLPRRQCPLAPKEIETATVDGSITRKKLKLQVEPDLWMDCYLFVPSGKGPFPACVCLHPTTDETIREPAGLGTREGRSFALDLARRGYVTIAPENFEWYYPHPTTAKGWDKFHAVAAAFRAKHPGVKGMAKMVYDASRSVDYLESLPMVRKDAIGAIGHSLGAKEVTYLMAFDERVVCGVSSEGGVAFEFTNYHDPWYLGPDIRKEGFNLYAHEVVALIAPRAWLLIGGNDTDGDKSWPYVEAVLPIYRMLHHPGAVGLFVHGKGHAVPPEAREIAFRWLDCSLKPGGK